MKPEVLSATHPQVATVQFMVGAPSNNIAFATKILATGSQLFNQ
jgi:hypothetical protein